MAVKKTTKTKEVKTTKSKKSESKSEEKKKTYKCCDKRQTERSEEDKKALIVRINRAAGQINGIKGMLESDAYCTDILVQVAAVNAALNSFVKELVSNHLENCVAEDLKKGNSESLAEFTNILQKFIY